MRVRPREIVSFFLIAAVIISSSVLAGCGATANKVQELQQKITKSMRDPGEKMVQSPEKTSSTYSCLPYKRNMLALEEASVIPEMIAPGDEVNQRVRYAMCPYKPSGTIRGKIIRTILFKGTTAFQDVTDYEFKPGTWTVDAFIDVPSQAQDGVYAMEVVLVHGQETIRRSNTFVVKSK